MGTETTPNRRNLSFAPEIDGRPVDNGIFVATTDQKFHFGKRLITWDGKIGKYSKSSGACYTGQGNVFNQAVTATPSIDYAVLAAAAAIGDTKVVMTNAIATAIEEDALQGGNIVLKPTETITNAQLMFRGIVGNSAAIASTGLCTIYLDAPIETALTTSNYAFAMNSPYSNIQYASTSGGLSFAGPAMTYVSATGYYFWTQTWGKAWIANQAALGSTAYYRTAYWRHDGSVDIHTSIGTNVTDQIAGFVMDNNAAANGSTMIMLQMDR